MVYVCPKYAKIFKCKADKCTDSCCIGWEIGIDENTLGEFNRLDTELGGRIRENIIQSDGTAIFKLCENDRCPFLDRQGLCDIIKAKGEDYIPEICREHPRYYNVFNDKTEWGIGLSCEEAARLILACPDIREEVTEERNDRGENTDCELLFFLTFAREEAYKLLYTKELPLPSRLAALIYYAEAVDAAIEERKLDAIYPFMPLNLSEKRDTGWGVGDFSEILELFPNFDFMDEKFREKIECAVLSGAQIPALNEKSATYTERLVAYFLHRYFTASVWDGAVLPSVKFAVVSALVILVLCGDDADETRFINIAKAYSKEMEYNEDNRDLFFDNTFTEPCLSTKYLSTVLI